MEDGATFTPWVSAVLRAVPGFSPRGERVLTQIPVGEDDLASERRSGPFRARSLTAVSQHHHTVYLLVMWINHISSNCFSLARTCGKSLGTTRIKDGVEAGDGEFPWMVKLALVYEYQDPNSTLPLGQPFNIARVLSSYSVLSRFMFS